MPELPEVETVRRQLAPHVEGREISAVRIDDPRWCAPQDAGEVEERLTGRRVESLARRGKHLILAVDDGQQLLMHLRMTGIILWEPEEGAPYERVRIFLDDEYAIAFCDPRRFGTGLLLPTAAERDAYLDARLGPEPLDSAAFTDDVLREVLRGRDAPVKGLLLDQAKIAGIGNIYADESLFRAGIHPARPGRLVKTTQIAPLRAGIVESLELGIASGGASIDDFRHLDGAQGSFQNDFLVHRRAGEPCPDCGHEITKLVVAGRGTYVCEVCQPPPRRLPRSAKPVKSKRNGPIQSDVKRR
ncbi:MAG: bifunctional DNA-formamidopyrimidine glycosylase/DNA-(apurinic or apyrimidinic site) lyase [Solirubrobacteraceae bacterium]|nr:bifunctional DNA-formamidopyrimidine glycosylase/DNA-(apurinic or apyrimidinic site) lyase [Solirubrobacteraceae bacterium]